jgi:putative ABC transport system permease protein
MSPKFIIKSAFRALRKHKMRSLLTTLGIIVGIISIITVMSIGQGAKQKVKEQIEDLGTNFIIVFSGTSKGFHPFGAKKFKRSDYKAIVEECDQIKHISPIAIKRSIRVVYNNVNWSTNITGIKANFTKIRNWPLAKGDFFSEEDNQSGAKVAVIGKTVEDNLFCGENPIGKKIRIKNIPFKVIGVLTEKGKHPSGEDQNDSIMIPLKTVQRKIVGSYNFPAMIICGKQKDQLNVLANEIRGVLRQEHNLSPKDEDNFILISQNDISQAVGAAQMVLNLLLIAVASISLLVGGIGIMNIMLVTVTERTREIGMRMALGAPSHTILRQFIMESIILCFTGGSIGVFIGINLAKLLSMLFGWTVFISYPSIVVSLLSAVLVGLFFGFYPAYKASKLNPIEALEEH